ncbi:MAG: NMD3-related protein [Candidatus Poseidoniia archaeon]|nr:NMD3-related protein [Candidatus Poseidoniia archaeon]
MLPSTGGILAPLLSPRSSAASRCLRSVRRANSITGRRCRAVQQCLKCGAPPPLACSMCHACFSAAHSPAELPQAVQAICCRHCAAREVPGGWELHDSPADAAGAALRGALAWADGLTGNQLDFELRELDPHRFRADGSASGSLDGVALEQRFERDILLEFRACTSCSRQAGGYYEATLQLRTPREAVLAAAVTRVNAALEEGAPQFFATEDGPVRGGYDFQLSSTDRARALARALLLVMGGEVKETSSLVGRREGRDVLRHTFGVRLPPVLADDVVLHDSAAWRVAAIEQRRARLRCASETRPDWKPKLSGLEAARRLGEEREVQVVSRRGRELQLLDPFTLRTVEARAPDAWGGNVSAVRDGGDTWFLWE